MISYRRADLIDAIKEEREGLKMIISLYYTGGTDCADVWFYSADDKLIDIFNVSKTLYEQLFKNVLTSLDRNFKYIVRNAPFSAHLPGMDGPPMPGTKINMYSRDMDDTFKACKQCASYYVGESEYHHNEKGTAFGIMQLYKPKFKLGENVKFNEDGKMQTGIITGQDWASGRYDVSVGAGDYEIRENDLFSAEQQ